MTEFADDHPRAIDSRSDPSRYLTDEQPPIGGRIKQRPEDFLVEEIAAYEPCGEGEHIYLFIEKRSLSTLELVELLARHFQVSPRAIGYAGLKDKAAVTRQVVSVHVPGKRIEDFPEIRNDRIGVLWADYHRNKLRIGHLKGNRFSIRVRGVRPTDAMIAHRVLNTLQRVGVPNRFGEQRFGFLENNHLIGRALLLNDTRGAVDLLLGPDPLHPNDQHESRAAYARGDLRDAYELMPRSLRTERQVLAKLLDGTDPARALRAAGKTVLGYYLTAFQSAVFNHVLDDRLKDGTLGELLPGDVAQKHDNLACFDVDAAVLAAPETAQRLAAFDISPSGPMWGPQMKRAAGDVDERERDALARAGLSPEALSAFDAGGVAFEGARRPLRVPITHTDVEGGVDDFGPFVRCAFELPRGAFATVVMREIMKPRPQGVPAGTAHPDRSPSS
ncbi:MAG: tRNA pseudouridine(13) synthase TruD [Phycisphaeraceae bacterium]|nr:tRNA pseudouridine(13) synthase TruD [Phycisphaeraceae bacterium]